jgi:hypothetical protein
MLRNNPIQRRNATRPQLSRVWIKTGDARYPLKAVWIEESALSRQTAKYDDEIHCHAVDLIPPAGASRKSPL